MMTGNLTLESLMKAAGCSKYPTRWEEIFGPAMEKYDHDGCPLSDWKYYEDLNSKYGCFEEYGYAYKEAVSALKGDEMLERFLVLLTTALNDKEHKKEDLKEFERPHTPEGKNPKAYEMVTGLAVCSQLETAAKNLKEKKIPEKYIKAVLRYAVCATRNYIWRHNGDIGFDLLDWAQKYIDGKLFPIGRLEMEFFAVFGADATVFVNKEGKTQVLTDGLKVHRSGWAFGSRHYEDEEGAFLASVGESADAWYGYPYLEDGRVGRIRIRLDKEEWKIALKKGDPVVSIHIPPEGKLTEELVKDSVEETRGFLAAYYPEWHYKAFACHSWLMSTQLDYLLGKDTNIARFSRMFRRLTVKSKGEDVFSFVFLKPDKNFNVRDLPERTTLEKALKQLYVNGGALYEMMGFLLPDSVDWKNDWKND